MSTKIEIGRCYWYEPLPTAEDDACPNCNYLFTSAYGRFEETEPTLVLVKRPLVSSTSSCPECDVMITLSVTSMDNVLLPYVRVMKLDFRVQYPQSDVAIKWLRLATENEVTNWFRESEKQADAILDQFAESPFRERLHEGLAKWDLKNFLDAPSDGLT
jgi:hypothetical protein